MQITIDLIKENTRWRLQPYINKNLVKKICAVTLRVLELFEKSTNIEVAILLTNNISIAKLNHDFRQSNKPTNVLSFPDKELYWKLLSVDDFIGDVILGDIAMSYETIEQEAQSFSISFENHFTHLLVHAMLHLIGYGHEDEYSAAIMEALEIKILKTLDIDTPPIYA